MSEYTLKQGLLINMIYHQGKISCDNSLDFVVEIFEKLGFIIYKTNHNIISFLSQSNLSTDEAYYHIKQINRLLKTNFPDSRQSFVVINLQYAFEILKEFHMGYKMLKDEMFYEFVYGYVNAYHFGLGSVDDNIFIASYDSLRVFLVFKVFGFNNRFYKVISKKIVNRIKKGI